MCIRDRNHGLLNISAEDFFEIPLSVPCDITEQSKIGAYFKQRDNLITLHQRKPFSKNSNLILTVIASLNLHPCFPVPV